MGNLMASVNISTSSIVRRPRYTITIGSQSFGSAKLLSITRRTGPTASTATIGFPGFFAGYPFGAGARVRVIERGVVIFDGWALSDTATEDGNRSTVALQAADIFAFLDKVFVGQNLNRGESIFPANDPRGSISSGWSIPGVLASILGPYSLPDE
jgi:hypothetical protein